ncbi:MULTISPECIES: cob(I)yrinic acid a,c-diamide adenosyltransferase [Pseudothermotoga]|jgi:cob(I)alamin adenosyltransferase|uniref:ATP:corrinoid adenosyltransferase BtuR/CobO/CobP n=1 Tax=Pseudothermotoga lettingae (strain ATCC BAA-301 / DSM 14385 / NBRC 107922 / TMO) TaxID=416591 RepID=A8F6L8_PSELT|nr:MULTISPECIES: cob(I)yrinic acid a,c-diamide adenosyltransferase [Pseudothermotoga]ABV33802.1 ATP:corrinoid adenosyltransferase BtuR/CobO/CobP [Pseudothermotoga lettingae TMO]KUK20515.1 MAG: ATP:corrinoid adenosyltransferase BtuR/CobO/CobP [Pseudothermotoga lettingae]MDI3495405.1 cob(I)alamin adenosyltransferase [Pseudothermotoga sp.]MDK2884390.1 cob(I)alamin adenosyltransferase [Pseudothermotoga sp.]GLI49266.1 cob(I)alamin adenolsyltransferase/cobinamide ATP-dependent adenolsyltransferase [
MGYIHVYTGNGKGKTTAAFGLAIRAACAGKSVYIAQFVKGMKYSELDVSKYIPNIVVEQHGRNCFIVNTPTQEDIDLARKGFEKVSKYIMEGTFDVIVLDEINIAVYYKLITVDEVLQVLRNRHEKPEIILTGRYAPEEFVEYADLVSEILEIKHYYQKGVTARKGIEF